MTPWSFSRWELYNTCARWFKYRYIMKLSEPPSAPMLRGTNIHGMLERRVATKGRLIKLPNEFTHLSPELVRIARKNPRVELSASFDIKWNPCDWMDADVACRMKIDLLFGDVKRGLFVVDYKTGKMRPEKHVMQLELYALAMMILETPKSITTGAWYVDHEGTPQWLGNYQGQMATHRKNLIKVWDEKIKPLRRDTRFAPNPSPQKCRWCPHGVTKNGPCKADAS